MISHIPYLIKIYMPSDIRFSCYTCFNFLNAPDKQIQEIRLYNSSYHPLHIVAFAS